MFPFPWLANLYMVNSTSVWKMCTTGSCFCTYMKKRFHLDFPPQQTESLMNSWKSVTCDPDPAVIAKAISIFYQNNPVKQAPESIPAMTMTGSAPAFYVFRLHLLFSKHSRAVITPMKRQLSFGSSHVSQSRSGTWMECYYWKIDASSFNPSKRSRDL